MLISKPMIHFINRVDESNCGDMMTSPLIYYYDYFSQFPIMRHDIQYIDHESIKEKDVVIIGGGGLLNYSEANNRAINRVIGTGADVIMWAAGDNSHSNMERNCTTKIDFGRMTLASVRDYGNDMGIEFVSDVSCKHPLLKKKYSIKRRFGIAAHKDYPITGFDFDTITNDNCIEDILEFIGSSEVILSNSFHMLYWAMLMGKKTICTADFSTRFKSYKYRPSYYLSNDDDFDKCVNDTPVYDVIDEFISQNDCFFEQVKTIVESRIKPNNDLSDIYAHITNNAVLRQQVRSAQLNNGDLLPSFLFINTGDGFSETQKLVTVNNVYGDNIHISRFDISGIENIVALRFDPIESFFCDVKIISARDSKKTLEFIPQVSTKNNGYDRFLSTDAQYIYIGSCVGFVEIQFELHHISNFEAERNIYNFFDGHNREIFRLNNLASELKTQQDALLFQLNESEKNADSLSLEINAKDSEIGNLQIRVNDLNFRVNELVSEVNTKNTIISGDIETISELNSCVSERNSTIEALSAQINDHQETIAELNSYVSERNSTVGALSAQIHDYQETISKQNSIISDDLVMLDSLRTQIAHMQTEINEQMNTINSIHNSSSWKITAPIRAILNFFRKCEKRG